MIDSGPHLPVEVTQWAESAKSTKFRGSCRGFPSLLELAARNTRDEVMQIVVQGGGRMPGLAQLRESERNAQHLAGKINVGRAL